MKNYINDTVKAVKLEDLKKSLSELPKRSKPGVILNDNIYNANDLEMAFCLGLLNQSDLTIDKLSDQLKSHKFEMIKQYIDSLKP